MFDEFLTIIFKSLRLDAKLYRDIKKFTESAVYFSLIIVILTLIIQTIPNNTYIGWMNEIGLYKNTQIKFRETLFWGLFFLGLKSLYFYLIEKYLFHSKKNKLTFIQVLTAVGYSQTPLLFNFLAFKLEYLFILFLTFIWYMASQTIAINEIFDYKDKLKSFFIVTSPIWISLILIIFFSYLVI
jgi:hypothetical protein|tara:strand:+ start:57 stop:608 length:552 start_codon:yes stop_codon:yes gene_type:complete